MKKTRIFALAIAFALTTSVTPLWATPTEEISIEEECQNLAIEQQIAEEELEAFMAECITAEPEAEAPETEQEETSPAQ